MKLLLFVSVPASQLSIERAVKAMAFTRLIGGDLGWSLVDDKKTRTYKAGPRYTSSPCEVHVGKAGRLARRLYESQG
jgi:hypothetical protein